MDVEEGDEEQALSDTMLYSNEFYILWRTGIAEEDVPMDTVAVSNVTIDDGDTMLIRVFHSLPDDDHKAEDKLLDWLAEEPYINLSTKLDIELFVNHSPSAVFSSAFAYLKQCLEEQGKEVRVEIKMARVTDTEGEGEEARENRAGLRDLHSVGMELSPVTGKDWTYLREILREMTGLRKQEARCRKTRQTINNILKNPVSKATCTSNE